MKHHQAIGPQPEADQTVRLQIDTATGRLSIRIGFSDQRLTAHGGRVLWSHFLHQKRIRHELGQVLPHDPSSPNPYVPSDIAARNPEQTHSPTQLLCNWLFECLNPHLDLEIQHSSASKKRVDTSTCWFSGDRAPRRQALASEG